MARKQPIGSETSATRTALLDAAEQLMRDEGYAAVTSRRLGAAAGVRPQLVHYYFPSMEQLFIVLYRRRAERGLARAAEALAGADPLGVIWAQSTDATDTRLTLEFMALSNHQKSLRVEMTEHGEDFRRMQSEAIVRAGQLKGLHPEAAVVMLAGVGLILGMEATQGMTFGHAHVEAMVRGLLAREAVQREGRTEQ